MKEKEKDNSLKYTCIFGGGAVRGAAYVGVLKALKELHIHPTTIAGSSVGAVFASLLSVGYSEDEIEEIFMTINFELFKDIHFGLGKVFAISKGGIFLDWLRELIEKKFYGENYKKGKNPPVTFADLKRNFIVITTDLTNFKYKEFSKIETPNFEVAYAVRISSTMPGLFKPAEEDGAVLVDGDLQKSLPLWRLSKNLCPETERILEFRLEGDYDGKIEDKNPITYMNTVYSCVTSIATDFIIDSYGHRDKFDYVKINTGSVIIMDFNLAKENREKLMRIGYDETMKYFSVEIKEKKKEILKYYKQIEKHLKKIKKLIHSNKIRLAREELGFLYMNFCPSRKFIDLADFDLVDKFKEEFMISILPAPLFGIFSLRHKTLIKSQINLLVKKFDSKIVELEDYIYDL